MTRRQLVQTLLAGSVCTTAKADEFFFALAANLEHGRFGLPEPGIFQLQNKFTYLPATRRTGRGGPRGLMIPEGDLATLLKQGLVTQEPGGDKVIFFDGQVSIGEGFNDLKDRLQHYVHKFDILETPDYVAYTAQVIGRVSKGTPFGFWAEVTSYVLKGLNIAVEVYKKTSDRKLATLIANTLNRESFLFHAIEMNIKSPQWISESLIYQSRPDGQPTWVPLWSAEYLHMSGWDKRP
jgi:hypothetical protein